MHVSPSLDYRLLLDRVLKTVDQAAYLTPASHVEARQRAAMREIEVSIQGREFAPDTTRALARRLYAEGRIDRVMMISALHVIAAHPGVRDWVEAARLAGEQEVAALELGGPDLNNNLASVDRHRGVLAFMMGHHAVALDHLGRALERQHNVENLGNVLCALCALGETLDAQALVERVRSSWPAPFVADLHRRIHADPDLALLQSPEVSS